MMTSTSGSFERVGNMHARRICMEGDASAIGAAREQVREFLAHAGPTVSAQLVADALLAVSELVTNAVRHAPGPCRLEVAVEQRHLRIAVSDTSTSAPTLKAPRYDGAGGFGLRMLRELAGQVETRTNAHGKKVSVCLSLATDS
jgi:anti-sigma regulatory factor (Ser/Thr protein kinase)